MLNEVARVGSDSAKSQHERYRAIHRLIRDRDKEIEPIFDHLRRSTAVRQIRTFRSLDLLTAEELRQFSPELAKSVEDILEIYGRPLEVVDEDDPGSAAR